MILVFIKFRLFKLLNFILNQYLNKTIQAELKSEAFLGEDPLWHVVKNGGDAESTQLMLDLGFTLEMTLKHIDQFENEPAKNVILLHLEKSRQSLNALEVRIVELEAQLKSTTKTDRKKTAGKMTLGVTGKDNQEASVEAEKGSNKTDLILIDLA